MRAGRDIIARHGETVFNAAARMQGETLHTPLTRAGIAQANAIGEVLRALLGPAPMLTMWASPTGRALQTLAIVAEHLGLDWHDARTDPRLVELDVGSWGGRRYAEIVAAVGPIVRPDGLLIPAPDGESYAQAAVRVGGWIVETDAPGDRLIVTHGLTSRVMRGLMSVQPVDRDLGAAVGAGLPQGSAVLVERGEERVVLRGTGAGQGAA